MRETPSQGHLEEWCHELTLGDVITEHGPAELREFAEALDRDSARVQRIARKSKRASRVRPRLIKAAVLKARAVYVSMVADQLLSEDLDVAGDLDYATAHMVRAQANAFGENWLARLEAPT